MTQMSNLFSKLILLTLASRDLFKFEFVATKVRLSLPVRQRVAVKFEFVSLERIVTT